MSATRRGGARSPGDYYRTPEWAVRAILPHLPAASSVCDAGAGDGALLGELLAQPCIELPATLTAVEIDAAILECEAAR